MRQSLLDFGQHAFSQAIATQHMLGGNGLTEGVLAEIEQALSHHELIKVKIASEDRETKQLIVEAIVRETGASNEYSTSVLPITCTLLAPVSRTIASTISCFVSRSSEAIFTLISS